jgi:histone H2A
MSSTQLTLGARVTRSTTRAGLYVPVARIRPVTRSTRTELRFPVARIRGWMARAQRPGTRRVSKDAAVFQAAVLEYLVAELLELAGHSALDHARARIVPRDLQLAVRNDNELNRLLGQCPRLASGHSAAKPQAAATPQGSARAAVD